MKKCIFMYGGIRLVVSTNLLLMQTNYGVVDLVTFLGKLLFMLERYFVFLRNNFYNIYALCLSEFTRINNYLYSILLFATL